MLNHIQIKKLCEDYDIVTPFNPELIQPASLDIRLGNRGGIYEGFISEVIDSRDKSTYKFKKFDIPESGIIIYPGDFILINTLEVFNIPNDVAAFITGRSSTGRLGATMHITAGFIDPQYRGRLTLEVANVNRRPIRLYPGDVVAQLIFYNIDECLVGYGDKGGRYQGDMDVNCSLFSD